MSIDHVRALMEHYPAIFMACHTRHVRDPKTKEVLSASQAGILDHLDEIEPLGLNDLARHLGVTPATMSIAVDRLVRRGYLQRTRDTKDARRIRLLLTRAGARIRSAQSVLDAELVGTMLAHLTPEERSRGLEGLALLAKAAKVMLRTRSESGTWARRRAADDRDTTSEKGIGNEQRHNTGRTRRGR
ncbi:MAG: MarR family transcriptional regulator [Bacteroidetes bacterium]|nr:MarR family transcriptional regulator [Bacteroidota bacterium]